MRNGSTSSAAGVREAIDIAGADDTEVVVLGVPCMRQAPDTLLPTIARNDTTRVAAVNAILREEAATRSNVHFVDLQERLCPNGTYLEQIDGAQVRYDGVHLTTEGANFVWTWLLDQIGSLEQTSSPDIETPADPTE